ncbi:MAG: hypothetical protein GX493_06215 [Firmicutes bacterium]|nr:hypothetical protein [Bacillota bacterium]
MARATVKRAAPGAGTAPVCAEAVFKRASGEGYILMAVTLAPGQDSIFDGVGRLGLVLLDRDQAAAWAEARGIPDALARLDAGERLVWEGGARECRARI